MPDRPVTRAAPGDNQDRLQDHLVTVGVAASYVLRTGEHGDGSYKGACKEEETVDCQRLFVTFLFLSPRRNAPRNDDAENQCRGGKNFDNS